MRRVRVVSSRLLFVSVSCLVFFFLCLSGPDCLDFGSSCTFSVAVKSVPSWLEPSPSTTRAGAAWCDAVPNRFNSIYWPTQPLLAGSVPPSNIIFHPPGQFAPPPPKPQPLDRPWPFALGIGARFPCTVGRVQAAAASTAVDTRCHY